MKSGYCDIVFNTETLRRFKVLQFLINDSQNTNYLLTPQYAGYGVSIPLYWLTIAIN
jgi:hypothetical protein